MDFRSLTRRELQALCKMNKIPANTTNVAMSDALQALDLVEGIEDFLKPSDSDTVISSVESPQRSDITSQSARSTGHRTTKGNHDIPKTPGSFMTSHKRGAKGKSSVSQVYSVRRSARLAAKRVKELSKQDNERLETITFDNFSEVVTEGLEVDSKGCTLHFDDEVEKAGIDLKSESDEGLDKKKAKEGAADLCDFSFETVKELKVDTPKSFEKNVDMILSNKLREGEESNDDKAMELDSSLDIGAANFILAENSANDGISASKESHVLPVAPKSSSQLNQEVAISDRVLKQIDESNEPNGNKISKCEAEDIADFTLDEYSKSIGLSAGKESHCDGCEDLPDLYDDEGLKDSQALPVAPNSSSQLDQTIVSDGMILPKPLKEPKINQISLSEVQGEDMVQLDNEDVPKTEETSDHNDDDASQSRGQKVDDDLVLSKPLDDEDETNYKENSFTEVENAADSKSESLAKGPQEGISYSEDEYTTQANSETSEGELSLEEFTDDENETKYKGLYYSEDEDATETIYESSDAELLLKEFTSENEPNSEVLSYFEDEDGSETISESLDGEQSLEEFTGDENEPNNEGLSYSEDEDGSETISESLDGEQSLEEFTGDENEPTNEGNSYSEDENATEASVKSSVRKEPLGESAETIILRSNNEAESKNTESSELLQDASETNMDAILAEKPVHSARKESSATQNATEVPQVDLIGNNTALTSLAFDHTQIPSGLAEMDSKHTIQTICSIPDKQSSSKTQIKPSIQMICSTPVKKSSGKTPMGRMSAGGLKCVSDDKENIDSSGRKPVRMNKLLKIKTGNVEENHEDCSLRELENRMKDFSLSTKRNAKSKEANRQALQKLPDNCLVGDFENTVED